jgi:hypothetical protein
MFNPVFKPLNVNAIKPGTVFCPGLKIKSAPKTKPDFLMQLPNR